MRDVLAIAGGGWIVVLGWPAMAVAVAVLLFAAVRRSRKIAAAGCLLAVPIFMYLALTPHFRWAAVAAFVLLVVFAWRIERAHAAALVLLTLPAVSLVAWLAWVVLQE